MKIKIGKYLFLFIILTLIVCQPVLAQQKSLFKKIAPPVFDSLLYQPDAFAIGDINGDGFEDLVISQSGKKPLIFYFYKVSDSIDSLGYWDFHKTHTMPDTVKGIPRDTVQTLLPNYGPIHIVDSNSDETNEVYFHINTFNQAVRGFYFEKNLPAGSQIVAFSRPGGFAWSFQSSLTWTFMDFNKDGLLDAIQGIQGTKTAQNLLISNVFEQNNQPVTLINESAITASYGRTVGLYSFDFNNDGWVDVFEINTTYPIFNNMQDFYYSGSETGFTLRTDNLLGGYTTSAGAAIGDYNNDGLLDIYQLMSGNTRPRNILYKNLGNHQFEAISNTTTLDQLDSRSAMWGDFNNDGLLDLVIAEYNGAGNTGAYPTLFQNLGADANGDYGFRKRNINNLPELNAIGNWNQVSFIDIEKDGDLDVLLTGKHSFQPFIIFENELIQSDTLASDTKHWIGFDLVTTNSFTKTAIGAKLSLTAIIDGKTVTQTRELQPFHGLMAQQTRYVHFGLKNATSASLHIQWPSGTTQQRTFSSINELNQYHVITEPEASKLVINSPQPFPMIANLEETFVDTLIIENVGSGDLQINSVSVNKAYYTITGFSETIPAKTKGFIALKLYTANSSDLGSYSDTLIIQSNTLSGATKVVLHTEIRSRPARFTQLIPSPDSASDYPFLSQFDTYTHTWIADFNQDETLDFFVLRRDSTTRLFSQDDNGKFSTDFSLIPNTMGEQARFVAVGDLNTDGKPDFVYLNEARPNRLVLSNGDTYEDKAITAFADARIPRHAVLHDIDKNGFLDIIIANTSNQTNQIILNSRGVSFHAVSKSSDEFTRLPGYASYLAVYDWNKDGRDDIFVAETNNPNGNKILFYAQTDSLVFKKQPLLGVTDRDFTAKGIHFFDFDNDGDQDVFLVSALSSTPSILLRNENNQLQSVFEDVFTAVESTPGEVTIVDFNMDGFQDILMTNEDFSGNNVLLQSTGGTGYLIINSGRLVESVGKATLGATLLDWNLDARPDVLLSNYFGTTELYRNDLTENNAIGIIPLASYGTGAKGLMIGTEVEVRATINGKEQIMSRTLGKQSLFAQNIQAVWFGLGQATSATYTVRIPGENIEIHGNINEVNTYHTVEILGVYAENEPFEMPSQFQVSSAYPNPFNPSTTIRVDMPVTGILSLEIFDLLGRRIFAEQNQVQAGSHYKHLDLSTFSSGIYILRVSNGVNQSVQKITLIK